MVQEPTLLGSGFDHRHDAGADRLGSGGHDDVAQSRCSLVPRSSRTDPQHPPGVSLAHQPPNSPRDWRVSIPESPYMHCTSEMQVDARNRTACVL